MPARNTRKVTYYLSVDTISAIAKKALIDDIDEGKALDAIVAQHEEPATNEESINTVVDYILTKLESRIFDLSNYVDVINKKLDRMKF